MLPDQRRFEAGSEAQVTDAEIVHCGIRAASTCRMVEGSRAGSEVNLFVETGWNV